MERKEGVWGRKGRWGEGGGGEVGGMANTLHVWSICSEGDMAQRFSLWSRSFERPRGMGRHYFAQAGGLTLHTNIG